MYSLLLVLLLAKLYFVQTGYDSNPIDLNGFTSKTAYRNSRLFGFEDSLDQFNDCKLVHVNVLFRHGTRYPGIKDMKKMKIIHKNILSSNSKLTLPSSFIDWKTPFTLDENKALSLVGFEEMQLLGQRFRNRMDNINGFKDFLYHVKVISSSLSRAKMSALTFAKNFLGNGYSENEAHKLISENDDLLRFFDNCPRYTDYVLKRKASKNEFKDFLNGPEIKQVIKDVQKKWNLADIHLTADDVRTLYVMCGFEIATNMSSRMTPKHCLVSPTNEQLKGCPFEPMFVPVETSPLCTLFEPRHFAIFEYLYDLKHYWIKSYGERINWLQSCILMSAMLNQIKDAVQGHRAAVKGAAMSQRNLEYYLDQEHYPRAVFWFGHAETLLPLVSLMNLFNQSFPMTSTHYEQRLAAIRDSKKRFSTFRVSNIAPFSGNVALELFHCSDRITGRNSGYRVQVRSNEKTVAWPMSDGGGSHVSLETFLKYFQMCMPGRYNNEAVCGNRKSRQ